MQKAKEIEMDAYHVEQREKQKILNQLLERYDDGSKTAFFCLAVNMLEINSLLDVMSQLDTQSLNMSSQEKADFTEVLRLPLHL